MATIKIRKSALPQAITDAMVANGLRSVVKQTHEANVQHFGTPGYIRAVAKRSVEKYLAQVAYADGYHRDAAKAAVSIPGGRMKMEAMASKMVRQLIRMRQDKPRPDLKINREVMGIPQKWGR